MGACAGNQHVLAQDGKRERRVHGVAERVEDRGHVLVDAGRVVPHIRHRQCDILGERPIPSNAEPDGVCAQVPAPGHAVPAAATSDVALAADDVAGAEVGHVGADLRNLPDELVANDERGMDRARCPWVPRLDM